MKIFQRAASIILVFAAGTMISFGEDPAGFDGLDKLIGIDGDAAGMIYRDNATVSGEFSVY